MTYSDKPSIGYVYKIEIHHSGHELDGKFYIGRKGSEKAPRQFETDTRYFGSPGESTQYYAYLRDHGTSHIIKIKLCDKFYNNSDIIIYEEQEISKYFKTDPNCLNRGNRGKFHNLGNSVTDAQRRAIVEHRSRTYIGADNPFYNQQHREDTKLKMRKPRSERGKNNMRGIVKSDAHRKKLSAALVGKLVGDKNPFYGKTHTDEVRQRMSTAMKLAHAEGRIPPPPPPKVGTDNAHTKYTEHDYRLVISAKLKHPTFGAQRLIRTCSDISHLQLSFVHRIIHGTHAFCVEFGGDTSDDVV